MSLPNLFLRILSFYYLWQIETHDATKILLTWEPLSTTYGRLKRSNCTMATGFKMSFYYLWQIETWDGRRFLVLVSRFLLPMAD